MMKPATKWAERVHDPRRIPEFVDRAFECALSGKPGPVYLDLPGDVLYTPVEGGRRSLEGTAERPGPPPPESLGGSGRGHPPPAGGGGAAHRRLGRRHSLVGGGSGPRSLRRAFRNPLLHDAPEPGGDPRGSPALFSHRPLHRFPRGGPGPRAGTRMNYVIAHGDPPRFHPDAEVRPDRHRPRRGPRELAPRPRGGLRCARGARGAVRDREGRTPSATPRGASGSRAGTRGGRATTSGCSRTTTCRSIPCGCARRSASSWTVTPSWWWTGRRSSTSAARRFPTHTARHRINSGVFGTMGVGLPCAIGAKLAKPGAQVIALHGDGSLGMNVMELDTAVRHDVPLLVVVSLNGGLDRGS